MYSTVCKPFSSCSICMLLQSAGVVPLVESSELVVADRGSPEVVLAVEVGSMAEVGHLAVLASMAAGELQSSRDDWD